MPSREEIKEGCYWDWLTKESTTDEMPPNYLVYEAVEPLIKEE